MQHANKLPFSISEYQRRLKLVKKQMQLKNIDLLFVEDPSNMAWISAYDGWSFYTHQGIVVFAEDKFDPIWWGRSMDANGARRTVWMNQQNIIEYADYYVQSDIYHPMQDLAKRIKDWGYGNKNIGVELENYYFSAKAYLTLKDNLKQANLIDASCLVNWQRAIKSDEEIIYLQKAAKITEKILDGIMQKAKVGVKKNELVADIYKNAITGVDDIWGDYPAIAPMLPSGKDASAAHLTWNDKKFKSNEATFFEIAGCFRRYHVPTCRTVYFGKPAQKILEAADGVNQAINQALKAAISGNRACDIAHSLSHELKKVGIDKKDRMGYSVGLSYPPDWGERTISIRQDDKTELKENMVFHIMPGIWLDDWGLETTESIIISSSKPAQTLCHFPRKLFVID